MLKRVRKGGKKGRKIGRNKIKCERYRLEGRYEKNKRRKIERHLKQNPKDDQSRMVLESLK